MKLAKHSTISMRMWATRILRPVISGQPYSQHSHFSYLAKKSTLQSERYTAVFCCCFFAYILPGNCMIYKTTVQQFETNVHSNVECCMARHSNVKGRKSNIECLVARHWNTDCPVAWHSNIKRCPAQHSNDKWWMSCGSTFECCAARHWNVLCRVA